MNILIVTEAFYPDDVGGAHIYVSNLARGLAKRGHKIWVMTLKLKNDAPCNEDIDGISILRYNSAPSGCLVFIRRPVLSIVNAYRLFKNITKEIKFDMLNCHSILPTFGISFLARGRRLPIIYTFHSSLFEDVKIQIRGKKYFPQFLSPIVFLIIKFIERVCYNSAIKIITLSDFSKQYLKKYFGISQEKIKIVPGGIDLSMFCPYNNKAFLRKKMRLPEEKVLLITVRRLVTRMGLENLINAMSVVVQKEKDIFLLIIGEGFLKEKLKKIIKEKTLEQYVQLLGKKDISEVVLYLQLADLFILPSEEAEWFGLVTLESLASGLPVLATPVGGSIEILQGLNKNLLLKGTSEKDIAHGILNFINLKDQWNEISYKCREYVMNNYSWNKMIASIENLYLTEKRK